MKKGYNKLDNVVVSEWGKFFTSMSKFEPRYGRNYMKPVYVGTAFIPQNPTENELDLNYTSNVVNDTYNGHYNKVVVNVDVTAKPTVDRFMDNTDVFLFSSFTLKSSTGYVTINDNKSMVVLTVSNSFQWQVDYYSVTYS